MAETVKYQGYTIQSAPQYVTQWEKWRLCFFISVDDHQGIRSREFSSTILYLTEREADIQGIAFGQRLIDGKVTGRSVADTTKGSIPLRTALARRAAPMPRK